MIFLTAVPQPELSYSINKSPGRAHLKVSASCYSTRTRGFAIPAKVRSAPCPSYLTLSFPFTAGWAETMGVQCAVQGRNTMTSMVWMQNIKLFLTSSQLLIRTHTYTHAAWSITHQNGGHWYWQCCGLATQSSDYLVGCEWRPAPCGGSVTSHPAHFSDLHRPMLIWPWLVSLILLLFFPFTATMFVIITFMYPTLLYFCTHALCQHLYGKHGFLLCIGNCNTRRFPGRLWNSHSVTRSLHFSAPLFFVHSAPEHAAVP